MLEFRNIEISDKGWIDSLLGKSDFRGCEYTFGNNFTWRNIFNIRITRVDDFYLVMSDGEFIYPAGDGNIENLIDMLKNYCRLTNTPLVFSSMNKECMERLKNLYGEEAQVSSNPDFFDYIYSTNDLIELKGKKYHSKRNHINRFIENNWSFEPITKDNIDECYEMNNLWCNENDCINNSDKSDEACVARCGMKHFDELGYIGGLIRVNGEVQAYTFGEPINSDTFDIHVEKALKKYQGAYTIINNEFLKYACRNYKYVNREEDMGDEGLRKAKRSYNPTFMEEKFRVCFKDW